MGSRLQVLRQSPVQLPSQPPAPQETLALQVTVAEQWLQRQEQEQWQPALALLQTPAEQVCPPEQLPQVPPQPSGPQPLPWQLRVQPVGAGLGLQSRASPTGRHSSRPGQGAAAQSWLQRPRPSTSTQMPLSQAAPPSQASP